MFQCAPGCYLAQPIGAVSVLTPIVLKAEHMIEIARMKGQYDAKVKEMDARAKSTAALSNRVPAAISSKPGTTGALSVPRGGAKRKDAPKAAEPQRAKSQATTTAPAAKTTAQRPPAGAASTDAVTEIQCPPAAATSQPLTAPGASEASLDPCDDEGPASPLTSITKVSSADVVSAAAALAGVHRASTKTTRTRI